jgi:hypothetical protein
VRPSPASSPTPSEVLFAVTEGGDGTHGADTVAIVGLDGYARAKAKFQASQWAQIPDAAVIIPGNAIVISGGVYFMDGAGMVRVLRADNTQQVVATFPRAPQQTVTWYAVSPDLRQLIAGTLTLPALGPIPSGIPWPTLVGPYKFDLQISDAGGQSRSLRHEESDRSPDSPGATPTWPLFPIGWTAAGPVAMVGAPIATQNTWPGGRLFQLSASGLPQARLGGTDCTAATISRSGLIPCTAAGNQVSVRDGTGRVVWPVGQDSFNSLQQQVSQDGKVAILENRVITRSGGALTMSSGFLAQGFLDARRILGRFSDNGNLGNMAWASLDDPGTVHDLGFKGNFAGTMSPTV